MRRADLSLPGWSLVGSMLGGFADLLKDSADLLEDSGLEGLCFDC